MDAQPSTALASDGATWAWSGPELMPHAGPHRAEEFARTLYAYEALEDPPSRAQDAVQPYSLQWFLDVESRRHSKQGRWIPKLLEFTKHSGETLLGLGHGLGTDWLQYARHGAQVIVCGPAAGQLELVRRNFEVRGLRGQFLHADPATLPLASASIDVALLSSLIYGMSDPARVVAEVFRVLRPGGKVIAVSAAKYDVDFWFNKLFFWYRWLGGKRASRKVPREHQFTGRMLRKLFTGFVETRVHKRQLRRSEVPHVWRWIPLSLLSRWIGRVLIFKGFKPLRAVVAENMAKAA